MSCPEAHLPGRNVSDNLRIMQTWCCSITAGSTLYEKSISDCTANTFQWVVRHSEALGTHSLLTYASQSDKRTCPTRIYCKNSNFYLTEWCNDNKECIEKNPRFCYLAKILNKIIVLVEKVIFFPSEGCSSCYYCWYLKHFCVFGS